MDEEAQLDGRSREILDFERTWWRLAGPKERNIRSRLSLSAARYYRLLDLIIDRQEALRFDPLLVKRLRRRRAARRRQRLGGSLGLEQ
ncbi:MAG: DUF3263 domain-containing protein [Actinomycetota bacterium]